MNAIDFTYAEYTADQLQHIFDRNRKRMANHDIRERHDELVERSIDYRTILVSDYQEDMNNLLLGIAQRALAKDETLSNIAKLLNIDERYLVTLVREANSNGYTRDC